MKKLFLMFMVVIGTTQITACGTLGGAVKGAGEDLNRAGDWIKSR